MCIGQSRHPSSESTLANRSYAVKNSCCCVGVVVVVEQLESFTPILIMHACMRAAGSNESMISDSSEKLGDAFLSDTSGDSFWFARDASEAAWNRALR